MPAAVKIGGVTVGHSRLTIRERMRSDTFCSFTVHVAVGTQPYARGDTLQVTDSGSTIFSGVVVRITEQAADPAESSQLRLFVEGRTGEVVERRRVHGLYTDTAAGDILKDINTVFSLGLTTTAVDDGPTIAQMRFEGYPTAREAFDMVARAAAGYVWRIGAGGGLAFERIEDMTAAVFSLTDSPSAKSYSGLTVQRTALPYFNRVVVSGGRDTNTEDTFTDYENRAPVLYALTDREEADANGLYEGLIVGPYYGFEEAYYAAMAYLSDNKTFEQVRLRYTTWDDVGGVGRKQTVTLASRNLSGTFVIDAVTMIEVVQKSGTGSLWRYEIEATESRPARTVEERKDQSIERIGGRATAFSAVRETSEIEAVHYLAEWTDALDLTIANTASVSA